MFLEKIDSCPVVCNGQDFFPDGLDRLAISTLQREWNALPEDTFVEKSLAPRRRKHRMFIFDRLTGKLARLAPGTYYQKQDANKLYGGVVREFAPIEDISLDQNRIVESIITTCAKAIPADYRKMLVNCHFMRITALPGGIGEPSPEGIHRDGFEYISLHLINRVNCVGGQSLVVNDKDDIVAAPMLLEPIDSLVINDRLFKHAGLPFCASGQQAAYRDMMLCSYEKSDE